jgi:TPR repeat protein
MAARDITSARLFYQSAVEAGDARAALRMGATFDPVLVDGLGAIGSAANQQEALYWYQYARDLDYADGLARDPIDRSDR